MTKGISDMSSLTNPSQQVPRIATPLKMRWHTDPGLGYMDLSPFSNGDIVVIAADRYVAGIALATGRTVWQQELPEQVIDLTTTRLGPVIIHNPTQMVAFDWNGQTLWRISTDHQMGAHSIRGINDQVFAVGVPIKQDARPRCILIDAQSGSITDNFPNDGDVPDRVPRGLLTSVRSRDPGLDGLFLYDIQDKQAVRLLNESTAVRAVAGSIAVIDTYDVGVVQSQLIAVNTDTGQKLWSSEGGPNMALAADNHQVVSVAARSAGHFTPILRDIHLGEPIWQSIQIEGRYATLLLAEQAVLVFVDGERLYVLERSTGAITQLLDEPSTVVYGACLAKGHLIDICANEVRCYGGEAA